MLQSLFDKAKTIVFTLVVILAYTIAINNFYEYLFHREIVNKTVNDWPQYLFFSVLLPPLWETFVFISVPLYVAYKYSFPMIYTILFASIVFGLGHGGLTGLCLQGVMGLIFSYVYVKEGYWSAVVTHGGWNLICGVVSF